MKTNNFEEKIELLEKVVNDLEKGDMSLDESLIRFEEGMKLSKECNKIFWKKRCEEIIYHCIFFNIII